MEKCVFFYSGFDAPEWRLHQLMAKSEDLIKNLVALPHEYEWLDFKESWFSKDEIGEYISAISNGAALTSIMNLSSII